MTRVVLDTNVLVSSFLRPGGPPGRIRQLWREGRMEVHMSAPLSGELRDVLTRPWVSRTRPASDAEIGEFLNAVAKEARWVEIEVPPPRVVPDEPDDDIVIATALAAEAQVIVSGDAHQIALGLHEGIEIVSPREFVLRLAAEEA